MDILHEPERYRTACDHVRSIGQRLSLVPTMGALHEGHLSLVREAKRRSDVVVVSIFVNPTQFGANEDLEKYPRTLEADAAKCRDEGVDIVFAPEARDMYALGEETRVCVGQTAHALCGAFRPHHFEGVATIVSKLLALSGPCIAVFGRKDYQQWRVIQRFVADLFLPVEVVGAPIVREADGLALSSRNAYLTTEERERALALSRALGAAVDAFSNGERNSRKILALAAGILEASVDKLEYLTIADPETIMPLEGTLESRALLATAAYVGKTRLIDNVVLGLDAPPAAIANPTATSDS